MTPGELTPELKVLIDAEITAAGGGGGGGSGPVETATVTVPTAWILAHSSDFAAFEIIAGTADTAIVLLGGAARLNFNTTAYTGATADTDIILFPGTDASTSYQTLDTIPDGFWDAETDAAVPLVSSSAATHQPNGIGLPLSLYLLGAGLADGDSDIEITVYYSLV